MIRNMVALRQLKRVVKAAPAELLHMRTIVEKVECGTARCALGWAIVDPWFRKNTMLGEAILAKFNRKVLEYERWDVVDSVFGLDEGNSERLFGCTENTTLCDDPHAVSKKDVLANIDRLLAGEDAVAYEVA